MNIKSLLIGSAAALVAVSGARAADAVVAEPEAVEYVRVCDAYGAGYFYIPGTETCLKIHGYVRYDMGFGELDGLDTDGDGDGDAWRKRARLSLRTSTASETDYGTLKTYTEVRFQYDNNDWEDSGEVDALGNPIFEPNTGTEVSLNFAYIELGGLRIGKDESAYTTFADYAGNVINDDLIEYGPFDATLISYTFTSGDFSAIVSLEDDSGEGSGYVPDLVAGAKYSVGDFAVTGVLGYDESTEEIGGKLRLDAKISDVSLFLMAGYGTDSDFATSRFKPWGGNWAIWGGASAKVTEKATLNFQAAYDDAETLALAGNVAYEIVPGFKTTAEVIYKDEDGDEGRFGGTLRFQRSF
ncbi:MAG: porin [Rhizobiaceae bacterium]